MSNAALVIVFAVGFLALLAVAWCVETGRRLDDLEDRIDEMENPDD